jgi:large subunit ribosomal protein L4
VKLKVYDTSGAETGEIEADDSVFGLVPNMAVLHQAYIAQMANRRAGSASVKRRGEVRGSTAKVRRQKGLGRARVGTNRSSTRVGGGSAHGPKPRSFVTRMPKKMRRLAIRSILSDRAASGDLFVVDGLVPDEPKTARLHGVLQALNVDRAALLVPAETDATLALAGRNLAYAEVIAAPYLNVVDLVNSHKVVLTEDAVRRIETLWGAAAEDAGEEVA